MSDNNNNTNPQSTAPEQSTLRLVPITELTPAEHVQAFKLVTDAQAQVQNLLNNHILFHPLTAGTYILALAVVARWFWPDYGRLLIAASGVSIAWLSLVGRLNEREVGAAEAMEIENYFESAPPSSHRDDEKSSNKKIKNIKKDSSNYDDDKAEVAGGKFYSFAYVYNNLVVATITARVQLPTAAAEAPEIKILGWTTLKRYRSTGLGSDLLALLLKTIKEEEQAAAKSTSGEKADSAPTAVVTAETLTGHAPAEKLLKKAGFVQARATPLSGIRGSVYGIERHEWTFNL